MVATAPMAMWRYKEYHKFKVDNSEKYNYETNNQSPNYYMGISQCNHPFYYGVSNQR